MIEKISFRNFRSYRHLDVGLEPFTVLVGPNASGKTTLLQGLHLLSKVAQEVMSGNRTYWPESTQVRSYGTKAPVEIIASGKWRDVDGVVNASSDEREFMVDEGLALALRVSGKWHGKEFFIGDWQGKGTPIGRSSFFGELDGTSLQALQEELTSTAILQFEADRLAAASYSEARVPQIEPDGTGLASVLAYLKLSQDEVFERIESALQEIVPAVRRVRIERALIGQTQATYNEVGGHKVWGNKIVLDMHGAKSVAARSAGEGTLMVLGVLTALLAPPFPRLVLLDDIELKLHPVAQSKLIEALRTIQKRDRGLQIVATSHSPFILNYLDPKEVRMTFLGDSGASHCEKLTAHPEFEKWKDLMSPGEFWSTVGENWLEKAGESGVHE